MYAPNPFLLLKGELYQGTFKDLSGAQETAMWLKEFQESANQFLWSEPLQVVANMILDYFDSQ